MELKDRVEQISAMIGELRDAANDGPRARQLIDSIFRSVHSLKAVAGAEGLDDLSRTAHEFENLLHSLRTGKLTLDAEVLGACEETAAALLEGSGISLRDRFNEKAIAGIDQLPAQFADLKDDERHRAAEAVREGSSLYVMEAVFDVTDFDQRFRQLKEQLGHTAEVISTTARAEPEGRIGFRIFYAAKSAKIPVYMIFQQARRAGEAAAADLGKNVEFVVRGEELVLEKTLGDALTDCLLHLVRNAIDHGIESRGKIILEATSDVVQALITVTDDGRGIEPANLPQIFQPGFSTAQNATEFSGRGVGLDVVATTIKELGGSVSVTSEPGKGSSFEIRMPNQSSELTMPNPSSDA